MRQTARQNYALLEKESESESGSESDRGRRRALHRKLLTRSMRSLKKKDSIHNDLKCEIKCIVIIAGGYNLLWNLNVINLACPQIFAKEFQGKINVIQAYCSIGWDHHLSVANQAAPKGS